MKWKGKEVTEVVCTATGHKRRCRSLDATAEDRGRLIMAKTYKIPRDMEERDAKELLGYGFLAPAGTDEALEAEAQAEAGNIPKEPKTEEAPDKPTAKAATKKESKVAPDK